MSEPVTTGRTGFKQAASALRAYALRPARVENCESIKTTVPARFVAVKLQRGLRDATVQLSDVCYRSDSLSGLIETVELGEKGKGNPPAPAVPGVPDPMPINGGTPPPPPPPAPAAPVDEKARALQALLDAMGGPTIDPATIRAMIQEESGTAIEKAVRQISGSIESRIADAVKAIESSVAVKIDLKLPDRSSVVKIEGQHNLFPTLLHELALGNAPLLVGPAGSGKTTAAEKAGEALGLTVFVQPPVADRYELLGFVDAKGAYQESPAYRWATTPGSLLIMDELDRSHPKSLTAIHSMLANGFAVFPNGQIKIPESNMVVATANTHGIGADAEYTGSARLDAATLDRFTARLTWDYDSALEIRITIAEGGDGAEAAWCQRLRAEIGARKLRLIWSPRATVAHCRRVAAGIGRTEALGRSVLATLSDEQRSALIGAVS